MKKSGYIKEKRRYERFKAGENVFAVIKRGSMIICKVVNVSQGGVFFYSDDLVKIEDRRLNVDIYINDDVYIEDVPAAIVEDFIVANEAAFDGFPIRYLRLSFEELNVAQRNRLLSIIEQSVSYS